MVQLHLAFYEQSPVGALVLLSEMDPLHRAMQRQHYPPISF